MNTRQRVISRDVIFIWFVFEGIPKYWNRNLCWYNWLYVFCWMESCKRERILSERISNGHLTLFVLKLFKNFRKLSSLTSLNYLNVIKVVLITLLLNLKKLVACFHYNEFLTCFLPSRQIKIKRRISVPAEHLWWSFFVKVDSG